MSHGEAAELPEGWAVASLNDVATMRLGKMLDAAKQKTGEQFPYLRNINVRWGGFDLSDLLTMAFTQNELEEFTLRPGDVLVCEGGEPGRSAVWREADTNLKFQKAIHRVRLAEGICPEWLVFQLKYDALTNQLEEYFTGSTIKHFTGVSLSRYRLMVPPLAEQRRIVTAVERVLERVNAAHENLERVAASLNRFRQAVLGAACSGRLTAEWRLAQQNCGADADDDTPSAWKRVRLEDVIEGLKYGTSKKCGYSKQGVPVLRIPNISGGVVTHEDLKYAELESSEFEQLRLRDGDVLMIRSNGSVTLLGKTALVGAKERDYAYAGYLIRIRPKESKVRSAYLNTVLTSREVRNQIEIPARSTSGVNNINSDEVRSLEIPLPPLEEQDEIVRRVSAFLALADSIEQRVTTARRRVESLTQAVLAKAFRGELVPTEAGLALREGRSYEPASELLARLKASVNGQAKRPRAKKGGNRASVSDDGLLEFMEG